MGLRNQSDRLLRCLFLGFIGSACMPAIALAHGAHVQARTTSAVEIQASYDSGEPMANAQVQVYAPENPETPVFSGTTDASGQYLFSPNRPGDWEVSVRQAGHGDIAVIPISEEGGIAAEFTNNANTLSPLQRGIMFGAVAWGCVGTALYFRRGKQ